MSRFNKLQYILARSSVQNGIVSIPKLYIEITGDMAESLLLNQIVFYADKAKRSDGFFYKSYKDWYREVCLTNGKFVMLRIN